MEDESKFKHHLSAEQKKMIKRLEWSKMGLSKEDIKDMEKNYFNGAISEEITNSLRKTEQMQEQIEKDSKKAFWFFIATVVIAFISIMISIFDNIHILLNYLQ